MSRKLVILGMTAGLLAATPALAQRVSWSVSFSSGPVFVGAPACGPVFVSPPPPPVYVVGRPCPPPVVVAPPPPPPPPPIVVCPPPPPPPPPPVVCRGDYPIRRAGVYAYARGPRRVFYPFMGHPGLIQEWCPISRAWITIAVQGH